MAFPYQFGAPGDLTTETCNGSKFLIYCDEELPSDQIFQHWYQYFNLSLAAACILIPVISWTVHYLKTRRRRVKGDEFLAQDLPPKLTETFPVNLYGQGGGDGIGSSSLAAIRLDVSQTPSYTPETSECKTSRWSWKRASTHTTNTGTSTPDSTDSDVVRPPVLRPDFRTSIRSISLHPEQDSALNFNPLQDFDLRITPLLTRSKGDSSRFHSPSRPASLSRSLPSKTLVGLFDMKDLGSDALSGEALLDTVIQLEMLRIEKGCAGIVLRVYSSTPQSQIGNLLQKLCQRRIAVIVMGDLDAEPVLRSIDFGLLVGIILENACILDNGLHRDFFRSFQLRETMGRCADERLERPEFFVGFLDLWHTQPTPAVARRAYKIAEYFGATLAHGPSSDQESHWKPYPTLPISLSGFDYLKRSEIVELQSCLSTKKVGFGTFDTVSSLPLDMLRATIPTAHDLLILYDLPEDLENVRNQPTTQLVAPDFVAEAPARRDFWTASSDGEALSRFGSFPISRSVSKSQYHAILKAQRHLKALDMLRSLEDIEILKLTDRLQTLHESTQQQALLDQLIQGLASNTIHVYKGLGTGFQLPGSPAQLWGLSAQTHPESAHEIDIFLSQKAPSDVGTVLHTYLAHHGVPRIYCYEEELRLEQVNQANLSQKLELPLSIRTELAEATTSELMFLLQQLRMSQPDQFSHAILSACSKILLEDSAVTAWNEAKSKGFLEGSVTMRMLLQWRLEDYTRHGARELPSIENLLTLSKSIDKLVADALLRADRNALDSLALPLLASISSQSSSLDLNTDLVGLMFTSALRRSALEDVYLETVDRCPLFLSQPDQAAVFSELWVLGSQCESYFGLLPRALGGIIYDRYSESLQDDPPSADAWNGRDLFTSYSVIQSSASTRSYHGKTSIKSYARELFVEYVEHVLEFGALAIFCMPAIVDVVLLTFVGRGFFITAFMADDERLMATYALLASLLISAGITGWVGSVGGHYLYNYAFDSMNFFLVQRLSGGVVLAGIVSICGLVAFSFEFSPATAAVFVAYLIVLCTYLNLLGILATMHHPRSPLCSGRVVLWRTIPFLCISPVLTTFVRHHDLLIYLAVLYTFLILLLMQYRNLCHEWSSFTSKVPAVKELDVAAWYLDSQDPSDEEKEKPREVSDSFSRLAQTSFRQAVEAIRRGDIKPHDSDLPSKVAKGLPYASWLLEKDRPSTKNGKAVAVPPELFTKPWFVQLEQALKNQRQLAQGLKEHNIFILFRHGKYDLAQSFGLFLVALMDHWVSVAMSARRSPPAFWEHQRSRYGMGLCVLYFLLSAIAVDATLRPHWEENSKLSAEKVYDSQHAGMISKAWTSAHKGRWLRTLLTLTQRVACILGFTTMFIWLLVKDPGQIIMYYAYIAGYTGVLIFQFNRCFTTSIRAHVMSVFFAGVLGFIIGCILHALPKTASFVYTDVLSLVIASITAAILSTIWVITPPHKVRPTPPSTVTTASEAGTSQLCSQRRVGTQFGDINTSMPRSHPLCGRPPISFTDQSPVSLRISELLSLALSEPSLLTLKTPWAEQLLQTALDNWAQGRIVVRISDRQCFIENSLRDSWSVGSCIDNAQTGHKVLQISAGFLDLTEVDQYRNRWFQALAYLLSESILYHTAVVVLGLSHDQALLAEHMLNETTSVSKRIEFQIATESEGLTTRVLQRTNAKLMQHLCLGIDVDTEWVETPQAIREVVLARLCGGPVSMNPTVEHWVASNTKDMQVEDFKVQLCLWIYKLASQRLKSFGLGSQTTCSDLPSKSEREELPQLQSKPAPKQSPSFLLWKLPLVLIRDVTSMGKWIAILSGAASEVERELWYSLQGVPLNGLILMILLTIWKICWIVKNALIYVILVYGRSHVAKILRVALRGASRELDGNIIRVELQEGAETVTGFASASDSGDLALQIFEGSFSKSLGLLTAQVPIANVVYSDSRIQSRHDDLPGCTIDSTYHYDAVKYTRWPSYKTVEVHSQAGDRIMQHRYDRFGRVVNGSIVIGTTKFDFDYHYRKSPKFNSAILRADYRQRHSTDALSVYWGVLTDRHSEDDNTAVPSERVTRVVRKTEESKKYITTYSYQHKRDPRSTTTLEWNGHVYEIKSPPQIFEHEELLLEKPTNLSFAGDDLLIHHGKEQLKRMLRDVTPGQSSFSKLAGKFSGLFSRSVVYQRVPTSRVRAELWRLWLESKTLDAVTTCWLDEIIMREEPLLRRYWRMRDTGRLYKAKVALDRDIDEIVSATEIPFSISQTCSLPIKPADLYTMGLGQDANQITNRPEDCFHDTNDRISIIFNDVGCWPSAPGGVSNCRRDLVNGHKTIRNHVLAETANDYSISRFQLEANVQSLKMLSLWGLDFRTASNGLIDNLLQSQVDQKINDTETQDIVDDFIPLLRCFVKGARTKQATRADLIACSNAILKMSTYFEEKDYNKTWLSQEVGAAWIEAWLDSYNDDPNIFSLTLDIERPSMEDFREALNLYMANFLIYSVKTPEFGSCPKVFQSTHHGISSLFGLVMKYRKGTTFGVWDHAILWRECCLNISPAQCNLPLPVQSMLLAGMGLAARLAYMNVDVILPCTSVYNPTWEAEIGTDQGRLGSKKLFARKIDPIANGINNMSSFEPMDHCRSEHPTVVMLSNVQFIKDIKTAVLSADVIVNEFGFKDYRLMIYGAQDRQPAYTMEIFQLIADKNLSANVCLAGFGDPIEVLKDAWLFMNSSLSEGLPLSIGEAALTGVPIVATEVGGTALVLTDPDNKSLKYGEVVPPNNPLAMARAQISLLGMLGQWAKYTTDKIAPVLPDIIEPSDVEWITKRMYEKTKDRQSLGLRCREVVLKSFHGARYLREHEQMYWIQWHIAQMRQDPELEALNRLTFPFGVPRELRCDLDEKTLVGADGATSSGVMLRWQDFKKVKKSSAKPKSERNLVRRSRTHTTASSDTRVEEV